MNRPERSVLLIGGAVAALVVVAIVAVLTLGSASPASFPAGSPEDALQRYLQAVGDGEADRAYAMLSTHTQQLTPPDRFADMVRYRPDRASRIVIDHVDRRGEQATVAVAVERFSGSGLDFNHDSSTRQVRLVRESDAWKIDELLIGL